MNIKMLKIDDLKPYENNPRKNAGAVDAVANSIKEFGFQQPVVIDKNNIIIAGHTRYFAAKKLKITEIPCVIADDLTEQQIYMYRLADNKTHELSGWDFDLLNAEFEKIFDFDVSDFGFDEIDLDECNTKFTLPEGGKSPFTEMTFTFANEQAEFIKKAMSAVKNDICETFGNENSNGNALYEVVRQWGEQKKLN